MQADRHPFGAPWVLSQRAWPKSLLSKINGSRQRSPGLERYAGRKDCISLKKPLGFDDLITYPCFAAALRASKGSEWPAITCFPRA